MRLRHPGALVPLLAVLAAIGGCGGGDSAPAGDAEVTVYASLPLRGPLAENGRAAAEGARLALADAGGEAGGVAVRLEPRAAESVVDAAANARAASEDSTAIAYLGELLSGATRGSLPITNEARMLQVSPGAGAADLVAEHAGSDDPGPLQPTGDRTFGRIVPSDSRQAGAAALWLAESGGATVHVAHDGTSYGRELVKAFRAAAREAGLPVARKRDAGDASTRPRPRHVVFYGGQAEAGIGAALDAARVARAASLVVPDSGLDPRFLGGAPAASLSPRLGAPTVRAVAATLDPDHLPAAGASFAARFRDRYGRQPGRYAAYGYEAMAMIIDALERASDPTDRQAVVDAFFSGGERDGALGAYSITELGETTLGRVSGYRLDGGRWTPERELTGP